MDEERNCEDPARLTKFQTTERNPRVPEDSDEL